MQRLFLLTLGAVLATASPAFSRVQNICKDALEEPQHPPAAVGFSADSTALPPDERERLRAMVPEFLRIKNLQLCILAQGDGLGDGRYNKRLAERRAKAVAQVLIEAGLPPEAIHLDIGFAKSLSYHVMERRILVLQVAR